MPKERLTQPYTLRPRGQRGLTVDTSAQPGYHVTTMSSADSESSRMGYVYVLKSPVVHAANGNAPLLKVGATRKHPLRRARELSAGTGVPVDYEVAYFRDFDDCFLAETLVHQHFADDRINESREFFSSNLDAVVNYIDSIATSPIYHGGLGSANMTGGTWEEWARGTRVETPMSELFATFEDRGDGVLNATEQAACRALEKQLTS